MRYASIAIIAMGIILSSCQKQTDNPLVSATPLEKSTPVRSIDTQPTDRGENGRAGAMPAYYDSTLFTINFKELPPVGEASVLAHNKSTNLIYMSDNGLPGNQPFVSVLDAIQGDGFNPLWREVQIVFNAGFTPRQLYSDTQVEAAASGNSPEITLHFTDEVYRCAVIGPKATSGGSN